MVDDEFRKAALALANKIGMEKGAIFHIDDQNYFAHITIYSPEFPKHNTEKIVKEVEAFALRTKRFNLVATGLNAEDGDSIVIDFERNKSIDALHETIVTLLNPLREGRIREKDAHAIKEGTYSSEQREMIERYGYRNVLGFYSPHLTLGELIDKEATERSVKQLESMKGAVAKIDKIGISEWGPNGTCTHIMYQFDLK